MGYGADHFSVETLVPLNSLRMIEDMLHDLIKRRAGQLPSFSTLILPDLTKHLHDRYDCETKELRLEDEQQEWFPVPGMHGGFNFFFEKLGEKPVLVVESWSRVCEGSGQRHRLSLDEGCELLEEGFV